MFSYVPIIYHIITTFSIYVLKSVSTSLSTFYLRKTINYRNSSRLKRSLVYRTNVVESNSELASECERDLC